MLVNSPEEQLTDEELMEGFEDGTSRMSTFIIANTFGWLFCI